MYHSPPCKSAVYTSKQPGWKAVLPTKPLATTVILLKKDITNGDNERKTVLERSHVVQALVALRRSILSAASHSFRQGMLIHDHIIRHGFETVLLLFNNLLSVYTSCGLAAEALHLFQCTPKRNVVSWTIMISWHAQQASSEIAFDYFRRMQRDGMEPNHITLVSLLSACSNPDFAQRGSVIHSLIIEEVCESFMITGTALVRMYCNCSTLENAHSLFAILSEKDVMSWATLISAYVQHDHGREAMILFEQMQQEGVMPNNYIYNKLINACAIVYRLEEGHRAHSRVVDTEIEQCIYVRNALVDMYGKCGSLDFAQKIFISTTEKDLVSWNAIMTAYVQNGLFDEVFNHFKKLKVEGLRPDEYTFSLLLSVCTSLRDINLGRNIHKEVRLAAVENRLPVLNALLDMYSKCECLEEARKLFDRMGVCDDATWTSTMTNESSQVATDMQELKLFHSMPMRDVFSWTSLIQGHVQHESHHEALDFFLGMQREGVRPNHVTLGLVVNACAGLLDVEIGRVVHVNIIQDGYETDVNSGNSLVDMYARCGNLKDSQKVFNGMLCRDAASWNVMIGGYAEHGKARKVFEMSLQMQSAGIAPDEFTLSCILTACRHAGVIGEACDFFIHMVGYNNVTASVHHYACIVDLLGRAGCLQEAVDFVTRIPFQPNIVVLMSFLSACKSHSNADLAEQFSSHIRDLAPTNVAARVLLSNISNGQATSMDEEECLVR